MPDTPTDQPQHPGQLAYAELDVFASYNSFYVQDETYHCTDVDDDAIQALTDDFVAIEGAALSVGTARPADYRTGDPRRARARTIGHLRRVGPRHRRP